jgi:predicted transglutaminase-like cysteine proteinase
MKRAIVFIALLALVSGCAGAKNRTLNEHARNQRSDYAFHNKITDWQKRYENARLELPADLAERWQSRVASEGWNEKLVRDLINETVGMTTFRMEIDDHWDTPSEFISRDFTGDCEDAAVFMLAVLRFLDYPYEVRIMAVNALSGGHALLRVRMPDGNWKVFETVGPNGNRTEQLLVYNPIVEFDEKTISYF